MLSCGLTACRTALARAGCTGRAIEARFSLLRSDPLDFAARASDDARVRHALYPGSFDPPTVGHLDLVERALVLFGRVTVAVAYNPEKKTLFGVEERVELFRAATRSLAGVEVVATRALIVQACLELGADVIVRGVRSGTDFDYEVEMARTNRELLPRIDTVLLAPAPRHAHVSSTLVRQIASLGGDASRFVPPAVAEALRARFGAAGARAGPEREEGRR